MNECHDKPVTFYLHIYTYIWESGTRMLVEEPVCTLYVYNKNNIKYNFTISLTKWNIHIYKPD